MYIFKKKLKLDIALAIPATNDETYNWKRTRVEAGKNRQECCRAKPKGSKQLHLDLHTKHVYTSLNMWR